MRMMDKAPVAQWIERLVADQKVSGSSPDRGTYVGRIANPAYIVCSTPARSSSIHPMTVGRVYAREQL
jgi:hypothetical protein